MEERERDPVKQGMILDRTWFSPAPSKLKRILFCGKSALPLTFIIFLREVGRLPGFCGLVYFSLFCVSFWAALVIFTLLAACFRSRADSVVLGGGVETWRGVPRKLASRGGDKVPAFDGRGASFLDYEHEVHLWMRTSRTQLAARKCSRPHVKYVSHKAVLSWIATMGSRRS